MRCDSPQDFRVPNIKGEFLARCPWVRDERVEVQSLSQGKGSRRRIAKVSIGLGLKVRQVKWVGGVLLNLVRFYCFGLESNISTLFAGILGLSLRGDFVLFV